MALLQAPRGNTPHGHISSKISFSHRKSPVLPSCTRTSLIRGPASYSPSTHRILLSPILYLVCAFRCSTRTRRTPSWPPPSSTTCRTPTYDPSHRICREVNPHALK
jgi:hypothetical protein